jgi:hypothetical protein
MSLSLFACIRLLRSLCDGLGKGSQLKKYNLKPLHTKIIRAYIKIQETTEDVLK